MLLCCGVNDSVGLNHHSEVVHLVSVTLQDDSRNILADVVNITPDGCEDNGGGRIGTLGIFVVCLCTFLCHIWLQYCNGLLHHPCRFHHLRQEHLSFAKQTTDFLHCWHEICVNDSKRCRHFFQRLRR